MRQVLIKSKEYRHTEPTVGAAKGLLIKTNKESCPELTLSYHIRYKTSKQANKAFPSQIAAGSFGACKRI